ncbi:MAG: potassium/proton antiporter [Tannerellaceae bacterium]|jgi:cell volume regulation protein A|nr:potassium/proton antiporter [Tannerellaceae bacterium]
MLTTVTSIFEQSDIVLLAVAIILVLSLFVGNAGVKIGIPSLLVFLGIGMLLGSDGIGIQFGDRYLAQFIGMIALVIILFSGGMDTNFSEVKSVMKEGVSLATVGVLLTAVITGTFSYYLFRWVGHSSQLSFAEALLMAAVMSSTDSASVFAILRGRNVNLKEGLNRVLELESGSNDPMAYLLTIMIIQYIQIGDMSIVEALLMLVIQMGIGLLAGFGLGRVIVWMMRRSNLNNESLYPILLLAGGLFVFAITTIIKGNGYLAVYVAGLIIGNKPFIQKRRTKTFFDGFAWLFQIVMFLTLGLLVNPHELLPVAFIAIGIGLFMIFIARPLAVFITLMPFKSFSCKGRAYLSWVGLRGAVPIIFAIYPLTAGLEHSQMIFNVVFFITIVSLVVQGTTVIRVATLFDLMIKRKRKDVFGIELPDEIKSAMSEIDVTSQVLIHGDTLMDLNLPDHTLAVMVKRDNRYFIPKGKTILKLGDKMLLISDNDEALLQSYDTLGITDYTMNKN